MDTRQLIAYVIRPVLQAMDMYSIPALTLVVGTAAQESQFRFIHQLGGGPALGLWQMEPATHADIWDNYLRYKPDVATRIKNLAGITTASERYLLFNLFYACAMCRAHYRRRPEALPETLEAQAAYWKKYYNTPLGRGTVDEYIHNFRRLVLPNLTPEERRLLRE